MDTIDSKRLILLEKISILNKCCSFNFLLIKEKSNRFQKILSSATVSL